ncbi:acyl-CoA dehydrogenase family protein [Bacillus sp. P14.5]|uniref:acyl-CoA dehydrogenase family protein n=1 Tax=Bacillus sp. P14.5 TaxID=1983400 RepID=UPI000DEA74CA|nr:acyl-CoA dehydrogenase family protein [Bacillus sp. P14.5]
MKEFTEQEMERIRSNEKVMELEEVFPEELLDIIYDKRLFKIFVPERFGGRMTSLPESVRIFEEASSINGSFGWLVTIGSGGGFFSGNMKEQVLDDIFLPKKAVIAGSGAPTGKAVKCEGGYRVTGQWKYCSGAEFATTFTANAAIENGAADEPEITSFAFTEKQIEILKDWNTFGLKATGSHSIKVENVFVPEERTFSIFETNGAVDEPVFSYPFMPFAQASFTAVMLGLGLRVMEEAQHYYACLSEGSAKKPVLRNVLDEQVERLEVLRRTFFSTIDGNWGLHIEGESGQGQYDEVSEICVHTAQGVREAAFALYPYLGMYASDRDKPFNRVFRDLLTASQHELIGRY